MTLSVKQSIKRAALWILDQALCLIPSWVHPNHLTHARWILTAPTIILAHLGWHWSAVMSLIGSSICDILDGHLARRRDLASRDGEDLDAIADKVFVHGVLWGACFLQANLVLAITVSVLDLAVLSGLRRYKKTKNITGKSNSWGKVKTWAQSFALAFTLSHHWFWLLLAPWTFGLAILCATQSIRGHIQDIRTHRAE